MSTFECPFATQARSAPQNIALKTESASWTYTECHQIIEAMANRLQEFGVQKKERIALIPTKTYPTPLLFFALFRIGAIACPLSHYLPLESIPQKCDDLGAQFLLTSKDRPLPNTRQPHIPIEHLLSPSTNHTETLLHKKAHATHLFTSGSSAKPKIACHSLGNHYYSALGSNRQMPLAPHHHYLLSLPLYHIAGIAILFRTFLAGATLLITDALGHPQATHLSLIPTQLSRLLKTTISPRHILLGGSSISPTLYQKALQAGHHVYPTYGMTEMSSQITTHYKKGPFVLGHPLPYRELKIAEDGEILVRGKTLFQGYYSNTEGVTLPLNPEGWFPTRDLGRYSPTNGLQISGRKDRLFISGGENIQPEEIEQILENIEGINFAKVKPIPDEEFGFRPVAYIYTQKKFSNKELQNLLAPLLPKYKIPITFHTISHPRSASSKFPCA